MDEDNVTRLKTVYIPPGEPNPEIVAMLEHMLEMAKNGEITDIAIATVHSDGNTGNANAVFNNWAKLIGAIEYVKHRVVIRGDD